MLKQVFSSHTCRTSLKSYINLRSTAKPRNLMFQCGSTSGNSWCWIHILDLEKNDLVQSSAMAEYDFAAEGDLFKAPEPIIEEPFMDLDPMTAAISMMSCGEGVSSQGLQPTDIDVLQKEQLLSDMLYECEKDLLEKAYSIQEDKPFPDMPKSVSSVSLSSMDWMYGAAIKPAFLDFPGIDFNSDYGMRRSFSEGDIKTLGNGNLNIVQSPRERPFLISNCTSEERQEKLSRYRNKKTKRNFGRKIKYACRKALADSQPRIRGRFAKTEESDVKRQ
ncbi:PREDICTED: two-component response regulator-like APRR9 isoform X3 [Lupinus angustifolius]|uniref:two-component response regulator-like APRR9 isoform X3 n=1 Tax=Lupinus angustifolius TaxID=3871 RepID=UPI00092E7A2A|nr:PREDICTED: two-component response regulator-like APRR9 isoform X3 [Lupinus angustifolius]XP_019437369.1 PREDICTED: two-component response regulator-like APRR9 isoform X3 [Lupinus angustifolius]